MLPSSSLEYTSVCYTSNYSKKSQVIYFAIIGALLLTGISLPFLFVDISVKASGVLKTTSEIVVIKAPAQGFVGKVLVKENDRVVKGQLLMTVYSPVLEDKRKSLSERIKEVSVYMVDLEQLVSGDPSPGLAIPLYLQAWKDYSQKVFDKETRFNKVKVDYERNKKLFENRVIASSEFEGYQFEYNKAINDLELLRQGQLSIWQGELRTLKKEKIELVNQLSQVQTETNNLQVLASVSGVVQDPLGIYEGSPVFANQDLAQITPEGRLRAELYLFPNDIGMVQQGMEVRMQVSAFNYNQWGLLYGVVKEVASDVQVIKDNAVFEVKCDLKQPWLQLRNGYKGYLKKGMIVQARMIVTRRSLWQLLYDKVDNWLNPNVRNLATE